MEEIEKAIEVLNKGAIIIYPTDTAFGIGCRIDNEESIEKLFNILRRPKNMAMPVLVGSIEMAQEYLEPISEDVKSLMKSHWPGALTVVYPCKVEKVPSLVRGGGKTLGVRAPNHEKVLQVISRIGASLIGTSANIHEEQTPYNFSDINPALKELVDYIIYGETSFKKESTIVDCSQKPWKILRQGAVKLEI